MMGGGHRGERKEKSGMKLLGLSFGRKMQNTEVLIKEAMMAAEKMGADVGMIRLLDLDIKPCTGCTKCVQSLMQGGPGKCVIKDDLHLVDEQLMECDALILGSPVFVLTPHGLLKVISDRFGPSHDYAFRKEAQKVREAKAKGEGPDKRSFKNRVAGFISVGGAITPHWLSLGLPLMNLFTFPSHIQVVDQMQVLGVSRWGHVVLNDEAMARARNLGHIVAQAMGKSEKELRWMGDEPGTCPVCHSNLLTVPKKNPVECAICGIKGKIGVEGDEITVTFSEEEQKKARLTIAGKLEHYLEIRDNFRIAAARKDLDQIPERLKKYEGYREIEKES
jgi:multimeric flavodoxin WrbA